MYSEGLRRDGAVWGPRARRCSEPPGPQGGHGHTRTLRKPPCHFAWSPYAGLTARTHSTILIQKNSVVCTKNSVLIDYVTKSPNVTGDDRSVMLLRDPCVYRKPDPNWMARIVSAPVIGGLHYRYCRI